MHSNDGAPVFGVGDRITWWSGADGRGATAGDPGARRLTGEITAVHRDPGGAGRVVAYSVAIIGALGEFLATVRPEHRPEAAEPGDG